LVELPDQAPIPAAPAGGLSGQSVRLVVLAVLVLLILAGWLIEALSGSLALGDLLSFKTIGLNYGWLKQLVTGHYWLAAALFVAGYALLGLFLLPGSAVVVVASGLLFGAEVGIPLSIIGSGLAASAAFATARFALGAAVARLQHPAIETLRGGFQRHELSYMMFLRLTPGLPFAVINAAPALIGVRYRTFLLGTVVGLLPSRIALSTAGAGLAKAIDVENADYYQCLAAQVPGAVPCPYKIHIASLLTAETIAAFFALAVVALTPALLDFGSRVLRRAPVTKAD